MLLPRNFFIPCLGILHFWCILTLFTVCSDWLIWLAGRRARAFAYYVRQFVKMSHVVFTLCGSLTNCLSNCLTVHVYVCVCIVSEMTYTVLSGTLNSSIPYHVLIPDCCCGCCWDFFANVTDLAGWRERGGEQVVRNKHNYLCGTRRRSKREKRERAASLQCMSGQAAGWCLMQLPYDQMHSSKVCG